MLNIKIDNIHFLVQPHLSILEACKCSGILLPRFCYHETLSVSGNCRMCLVEIEGVEKPVASCVTEVDEGMSIWLNSPFVQKARENVIEALLVNHPLDCPICDQAGECDLQDQVKLFGNPFSRFTFKKTAVEDKEFGPLIKTIMSRCIKCTRCVRFSTEIAGVDFFGTLNRGGGTEIGAYVSKIFNSEISGNVIDLCPVGALTARPYAFEGRPWESRLVESVDTTDSFGSTIYVDHTGLNINRVLPRTNKHLKTGFISDKARFSFDANLTNRLNDVLKLDYSKEHKTVSWDKLFELVNKLANTSNIDFLVNDKCDVETLAILRFLQNKYSKTLNVNSTLKSTKGNFYISKQYNIGKEFHNIEDLIVLVGSNLRVENAILNAFLRLQYQNSLINIHSYGLNFNENIPTTFLYLNIDKCLNILEGKSLSFSKSFFLSKEPFILFGDNIASRVDNMSNFISNLTILLPNAKILDLKKNVNSEGFDFLNLNQTQFQKNTNIVAINLEDTVALRRRINKENKVIYFNSHGSAVATKFNFIAPLLTSFETKYVFMTLGSKLQQTQKSVTSYFNAKKFSSFLKVCFNIDVSFLKSKNFFSSFVEHLFNDQLIYNSQLKSSFSTLILNNIYLKYRYPVSINTYCIKGNAKDFYCSDIFSKNSFTMLDCKAEYSKNFSNFSTKRN